MDKILSEKQQIKIDKLRNRNRLCSTYPICYRSARFKQTLKHVKDGHETELTLCREHILNNKYQEFNVISVKQY